MAVVGAWIQVQCILLRRTVVEHLVLLPKPKVSNKRPCRTALKHAKHKASNKVKIRENQCIKRIQMRISDVPVDQGGSLAPKTGPGSGERAGGMDGVHSPIRGILNYALI